MKPDPHIEFEKVRESMTHAEFIRELAFEVNRNLLAQKVGSSFKNSKPKGFLARLGLRTKTP